MITLQVTGQASIGGGKLGWNTGVVTGGAGGGVLLQPASSSMRIRGISNLLVSNLISPLV